MVKIISRFFAFCGEENRRRFHKSILLGVLQAIFEALKIPAIACMVRALLRGNVTTQDILLALGIMLFSILGSSLVKSRSIMLQTEGGYDTCARKRVEIAEHMRYLPMGYFNEKSLGQITSVTTNVMQNLENVATRVISQSISFDRHKEQGTERRYFCQCQSEYGYGDDADSPHECSESDRQTDRCVHGGFVLLLLLQRDHGCPDGGCHGNLCVYCLCKP